MITFIIRVNTDCSIGHNGLRTRGCNCKELIRRFPVLLNEISKVVKVRFCLLVDYLLIAHSCKPLGIPVNHSHTSVNKPFFIEIYKCIYNRFAEWFIHSKFSPLPVTRCTKFLKLLKYNTSMLLLPLPSVLHKLIPC